MGSYHSEPALVNRGRGHRVQRTGSPSFAPTQAERILELLRKAGPEGINRKRFLDPNDLAMSQVGARLDELTKQGYRFSSFHANPGDKFVTYRLDFEPSAPVAAPRPVQSAKPKGWQSSDFRFGSQAEPPKQAGLFQTFMAYETGAKR